MDFAGISQVLGDSPAVARLNLFIENDLGGQIIRLTESRLMLLPPGCRGIRGLEAEAFSVDPSDFS